MQQKVLSGLASIVTLSKKPHETWERATFQVAFKSFQFNCLQVALKTHKITFKWRVKVVNIFKTLQNCYAAGALPTDLHGLQRLGALSSNH